MMAEPSSSSVNVSDAPAVVEWTGPDGQPLYLTHPDPAYQVTCDIRLDAATNSAFVKLRIPVVLKALPRAKTSVFLFVHPERIQSLALNETDAAPQPVQKKLCTNTVALRFALNKPPVAVVPLVSLVPKKKAFGTALDLLRALARETAFTVYLPHRASSNTQLQAFCTAASNAALRSIARDADLSSLYGGKGAKAIERGCFDQPTTEEKPQAESPPSYDELALTPPPPPPRKADLPEPSRPAKKRRRGSADDGGVDKQFVKDMCRDVKAEMREQLLAEIKAHVAEQLGEVESRIMKRVGERLDEHQQKVEERLGEHKQMVEQRLGEHKQMVEQMISDQRELVEEQLDELRDETDKVVDIRIEDQVAWIKEEVHDHLTDELENVEDRIKDELGSGHVTLQFN